MRLLQAVVLLIGLPLVAVCTLSAAPLTAEVATRKPAWAPVYYLGLLGLCSALVFFVAALGDVLRLLDSISRSGDRLALVPQAFRRIRRLSILTSAALAACLPFAYVAAQLDDAPGLVLITLLVTATPLAPVAVIGRLERHLAAASQPANEPASSDPESGRAHPDE